MNSLEMSYLVIVVVFLSYASTEAFKADISLVPYHVSILLEGKKHCSGSLISEDLVLSAARCFSSGVEVWRYAVQVGSIDSEKFGVLEAVRKIKIHEKFNMKTNSHDIALVRLVKKVRVSDSVKPIPLDIEERKNGTIALATGWVGQDPSIKFLGRNMSVKPRSRCLKDFYKKVVPSNVICAEGKCIKDFGSPLVNNEELIGIFSWCSKGKLSLYTNVAAHISWILESIQFVYNSL